jgi:hypothetical protein
MTKSTFEKRASEMKKRLSGELQVVPTTVSNEERKFSLRDVAQRLGVSYSTARRLLSHEEGVGRYSTTTAGTAAVFPSTPLKRNQRVRMTYVVPESVLSRLQIRMHGEQAA